MQLLTILIIIFVGLAAVGTAIGLAVYYSKKSSPSAPTGPPSFDNMTGDLRFYNSVMYDGVPQDIYLVASQGSFVDSYKANYSGAQIGVTDLPILEGQTNPQVKATPTFNMPTYLFIPKNSYVDISLPPQGVGSITYSVQFGCDPNTKECLMGDAKPNDNTPYHSGFYKPDINSRFEISPACAYIENGQSSLCSINYSEITNIVANVGYDPLLKAWFDAGGRIGSTGVPYSSLGTSAGPFLRQWGLGSGTTTAPICNNSLDISFVDGFTIPMSLYIKKRSGNYTCTQAPIAGSGSTNVTPNPISLVVDCANLTNAIDATKDCPTEMIPANLGFTTPGPFLPNSNQRRYTITSMPTVDWRLNSTYVRDSRLDTVSLKTVGCAQPCSNFTKNDQESQLYNPNSFPNILPSYDGAMQVTGVFISNDSGVSQLCCQDGNLAAGCNTQSTVGYGYYTPGRGGNGKYLSNYVNTVRAGNKSANGVCRAYAWQYDDSYGLINCPEYDATMGVTTDASGNKITERNKYLIIFGSALMPQDS